MTMACNEWAERVSAYIDDELSAADHDAVEAHLAACPECAKAAADLRKVSSLIRALPRVAAPADLVGAVRATVAPPAQGRLIRFVAANRSWLFSAAAVVATMLIIYGFYSPSRNAYRVSPNTARPVGATDEIARAMDSDRAAEAKEASGPSGQSEFDVARKDAPGAGLTGEGVATGTPAPPQPEQAPAPADRAAKRVVEEKFGDAAAPDPRGSMPPVPAAPGAGSQEQKGGKAREKQAKGLAQDLLESGRQLTMLCGDADDAARKVTRLLRDLRVSYRLAENHTTHVVADIPADRVEEVLLALEMLEPRRFGWRVPALAHDELAKKEPGNLERAESRPADLGWVLGEVEDKGASDYGRRGRFADDLLVEWLREQRGRKEKAPGENEQKYQDAGSLTLIISLEAKTEAERSKERVR